MSRIWFVLMLSSFCLLFWTNPESVLPSMIDASASALALSINLCGVYAVWLGILELVDASGLGKKIATFLRPIIKKLFHTKDEETEKLIALNISSNMLGLGNASTPLGIKALQKLDDGSSIANDAVIMLVILNATSIQLLPSTIIGLRINAGSTNAGDIIVPTLIVTIFTCILGITLAKIFANLRNRKKKA